MYNECCINIQPSTLRYKDWERTYILYKVSYIFIKPFLVLLICHAGWLSISFQSPFEHVFFSCLSTNVCPAPLLILWINVVMYSTYDVLTIFCNLYHHHLLSYGGRFWKILWVAICERVFTDESKAVLLFHNVLATQEDNIRSSMATSVEKEILLCCGSICFTFISKRLGHAFPSIFVYHKYIYFS